MRAALRHTPAGFKAPLLSLTKRSTSNLLICGECRFFSARTNIEPAGGAIVARRGSPRAFTGQQLICSRSSLRRPSLRPGRLSLHNLGAPYSRASSEMAATKIDGVAIAKKIREALKSKIEAIQATDSTFKPSLTIVQVGSRDDSSGYVRMKLKAAKEAGIICNHLHFDESVSQSELLGKVQELNDDASVHGILVQLPLPAHISEDTITSAVAAEKDVDGFVPFNVGQLAKRRGSPHFVPCTPRGIMVLLEESGVDLQGKHAVVLGRSDIVGGPVSHLLKHADATVTVGHSRSRGLQELLRLADVVVVAIGQPEHVQGSWLKPGAVVIDVGMNYIPDTSKKSGYRIVGDVDYSSAAETASMITPVPGGVGPMTVAMLLRNVVDAAVAFKDKESRDRSGSRS